MITIVKSTALHGLEGQIVAVEVDVSLGLPSFDLVGLPDTAVREAKDRVRAAIKNAGYEFPVKRITVNLAPADIKKEGPIYDLPIAIGILAATGQVNPDRCGEFAFIGELSLNGSVRSITGALPNTIAALEAGISGIIVPGENAGEAALVDGIDVYPANCIGEIVEFLDGETPLLPYRTGVNSLSAAHSGHAGDFAEVKGQFTAKRALEIAAAGGHNVIMIGSPGSGKTMLARRLPGILPDLTFPEALEATKIHSLAGLIQPDQPLVNRRPFRSPHHTASTASITGGGRVPKPGEVSLAHQGVLFLDEIPEFRKDTLEALRQPLEDGVITIARVSATINYPAGMMLVAACNPCPCGYYGDSQRDCQCSPHQVARYFSRLSGPLLDRIDIHVEVPRLTYTEISSDSISESSQTIKTRVEAARKIQRKRFSGDKPEGNSRFSTTAVNARLKGADLSFYCKTTKQATKLLKEAFHALSLSARSYDRILKVARTIADLADSELIEEAYIAEALQYRSLDRKL